MYSQGSRTRGEAMEALFLNGRTRFLYLQLRLDDRPSETDFFSQGTRLLEGVDGAKPELFSSLEFTNVRDWHRNSLAARFAAVWQGRLRAEGERRAVTTFGRDKKPLRGRVANKIGSV